jgi:NADH-quinone oxidoreductase subunit E
VVQQRRGWLSDEMLQELAQRLALSVESLEGLATFYNRLFRRPVGRHRIWYCDSVSCWLMGCERLCEQLQQQLGIAPGETTADGRFTLLPTVCLGVCDQAPVLAIDDDLYPATDTMELSPLLEAYD